jgi:hypothetical protein
MQLENPIIIIGMLAASLKELILCAVLDWKRARVQDLITLAH